MQISVREIEKISIRSLQKAFFAHEELGDMGTKPVRKNPYGETSLAGDIKTEEAVIESLRKSGLPFRIISEEHGIVNLVDNPAYLATLDGIDGTSVYRNQRGNGRYGTMLGVFSGLNPKYDDYVFSGIMEHSTKRLFFATKNVGSFVLLDNDRKRIKCSGSTKLGSKIRILVAALMDKALKTTIISDTFTNKLKNIKRFEIHKSSAAGYADLSIGKADLVLEATRKNNLELACAYGLVKESGGVVISPGHGNIGDKYYLSFGQKTFVPTIAASTMELAKEMMDIIST